MRSVMNLWWPMKPFPGNFGDILSPWLLNALGHEVHWVHVGYPNKVMAGGSTAGLIHAGDRVWGVGILSDQDSVEQDAEYFAVRGPLTGAKVGCTVYGDPGLLCSRILPMGVQPTKEVGVIPHYTDYKKFDVGEADQINIMTSNPRTVISSCLRYERIIASALHGIIVAHSYGRPAGWWRPSDNLAGDDSKFEDYAQSVDIELVPQSDYKKVLFSLPSPNKVRAVQDALLQSLPSREMYTCKTQ